MSLTTNALSSSIMPSSAARVRAETLRDVIAECDRRLDGLLPMDVDGVADTFRDEPTLLAALQLRWYTSLSHQLDVSVAELPDALEGAAVRGWRRTSRELPGVRLVLDHYAEHPTDDRMAAMVAKGLAKERQLLAVASGVTAPLAPVDEETVLIGRALETRAREGYQPPNRPASPTLLGRLKAVLAA